ncbi:MAG: hypothetical protein AAFQ45_12980 [Pseudomonadota bacterium]
MIRSATAAAILLAGSAIAAATMPIAPVAAKVMQAPDSRVALTLPDGFTKATRFKGFEHPSGASIVVLEVPAVAYARMARAMNPNTLATRGVLNAKALDLGRSDKHVAFTAEQRTAIGMFDKVLLLIGDETSTALVTANVPRKAAADGQVSVDAIKSAFAKASFAKRSAAAKPLYAFTYTGPFKKAGSVMGAGQIYNLKGEMPKQRLTKAEPNFIAVHALNKEINVPNPPLFAAGQVEALRGFTGKRIIKTEAGRIAGIEAHRHTVSAKNTSTGDDVVFYHVMLFPEDGGYYRFIASTPAADADTYVPEFEKMAASFELAK